MKIEGKHEVLTRTKSVTTGGLSREIARWKYNTGEDAGYLQLDEKTPEALLQLGIGFRFLMRSIGGRLWSSSLGKNGAASEIPLFKNLKSNLRGKNARRQCLAGSLIGAIPSQRVTEGSTKVG